MAVAVASEQVEEIRTRFNTVRVQRTDGRVDLDVEGATFATWHPTQMFTGYSWDAMSTACLLHPSAAPRSVLLLGLGGGTVTRQLRHFFPRVRLVGVEIDGAVIDLARRYMDLDTQSVETHIEDAYAYLRATSDRFDVILDDLFLTGADDVVRTATPEGATLDLLRSRLAPGGVLAVNLITDAGDHAAVRKKSRAAFRAAFPTVRVVKPPLGLNEILVGGDVLRTGKVITAAAEGLSEASDKKHVRGIVTTTLPA